MEFLTSPQDAHNDFCVLRGVIPPGVFIPLYSHPDTEDFFVISGQVQALRQGTRTTNGSSGKRGITSMCPVVLGTPDAMSPVNL